MRTRPIVAWFMALACMVVAGCQDKTVPADTVAAAEPSPDMKIMQALDYYEPMYKVNENGRVTQLRIPWRHVPNSVLAEIGKLTELEAIELSGTTVTDESLALLKDLQNLRSMSLVHTSITDRGLVHLANLPSLRWLWLPRNRVTQEGVERLKQARPDLNVYLL